MTIDIQVAAPSLSDHAKAWFTEVTAALGQQAQLLGDAYDIPSSDVTVTLSDDFPSAVDEVLQGAGWAYSQQFTTERVGGVVAAKTITTGVHRFHIVFNADAWQSLASGSDKAATVVLVAHEYAHVLMERSWDESGALADERIPSITGTQVARSIARTVAAEIRADLIGAVFLRAFATAEVDGIPHRLTLADLWGDGYGDQLQDVLESVHPGWPDTVDSYRIHELSHEHLIAAIFQSTEGVLTLLAHADAVRHDAGRDSVLDEFAGHPAVVAYIGEVWATIRTLVFDMPILVRLPDVRDYEHRIMDAGSSAILAMWERLGLTVEERGNDEWALWVKEPLR